MAQLLTEKQKEQRRKTSKAYAQKNKHKIDAYYKSNKEHIDAKRAEWRKNNIDKVSASRKRYADKPEVKEKSRQYYIENKEKLSAAAKIRYQENRDKRLNQAAIWAKSNPEKVKQYHKKHIKSNPNGKISYILRKRINNALKVRTNSKTSGLWELSGCDAKTLKAHIEQQFKTGMTWENHGRDGWHVDHIVPCALFDLSRPEQQKSCFNYRNLQPIWAEENRLKSDILEVCPV